MRYIELQNAVTGQSIHIDPARIVTIEVAGMLTHNTSDGEDIQSRDQYEVIPKQYDLTILGYEPGIKVTIFWNDGLEKLVALIESKRVVPPSLAGRILV